MNTDEYIQFWILIVTGAGVLTALGTIIYQSHIMNEQMKLNFFADYTKRYQEIILNFPEEINKDDFNYNELNENLYNHTLRYMRAYFDLCSEEYYLYQKKKIDKKVWDEWASGIEFAFSKKAIIDAWHLVKIDTIFYRDFFNYIEKEVFQNQ